MGLKDLTVAEMEGRLREMSATTFDGVFVWRISDFAKKRQDAIAGRAPAMFSPGNSVPYVFIGPKCLTQSKTDVNLPGPSLTCVMVHFLVNRNQAKAESPFSFLSAFYTSKYGYKMCLRIYLNGDGTGRGSHLSLFFVVMRGLSDALLKWPFNQKVKDLQKVKLKNCRDAKFCTADRDLRQTRRRSDKNSLVLKQKR